MRKAFHYTTIEKYKQIQNDGYLKTKSPLIHPGWIESIPEIKVPKGKFIYAFLDISEPETWKQTGFLRDFLDHYLGGKEIALLSFPLNEKCSYVLEARHIFDLHKQKLDAPEAFRRYLESMIGLKEYRDQYEMPEVVISKNVPLEKIIFERKREPVSVFQKIAEDILSPLLYK